jgi:hypothetical protein
MFDEQANELVPILTDCAFGTLDGQDVAVVLHYASSPEELAAGMIKEMVLAMTPVQALELGAGLVASANLGSPERTENDQTSS